MASPSSKAAIGRVRLLAEPREKPWMGVRAVTELLTVFHGPSFHTWLSKSSADRRQAMERLIERSQELRRHKPT